MEVLLSVILVDLPKIILSGIFVGFVAKIFRRSFIRGFIAGILPKILLPLIFPFISIVPLPFLSFITLILLYSLFIWILCGFAPKQSLIIAIVAIVVLEFGVVYFKEVILKFGFGLR